MRDTSEARLIGVYDRADRLMGLKRRGLVNGFSTVQKGPSKKKEVLRLFSANVQNTNAANLVYSGPASGGYVDSLTTEVPGDADGFFVILANGSTTQTLTVAGLSFRVAGDLAARPYNAVAATAGAFNGAAGVVVPVAPSADLGSFVRSDTVWLSTVPRTDEPDSARRIVHVRVAYTAQAGDADGSGTKLSYWSRNGSRWTRSNPSGFKTYTWQQAGNLATNIGNQGNLDGGCTIFGLGYISRGRVCVVGVAGDSFVGGFEEGFESRGFWTEGIIAAGCEYMNLGRGGDTAGVFTPRALAVLSLYSPSALIHMAYSTNNGAASDAAINAQRQQTARAQLFCESRGIAFAVSNSMPKTNAGNTASTWDAAGLVRQAAYDAEISGLGVDVFDLAALTRQAGSGLWKPGASADGVHLASEYADAVVVPAVSRFVQGLPVGY